MAISGTINGSVTQQVANGTFSFYLTWSAVQNVAGNYSDVTVNTYWSTTNTWNEFDTVGTRAASITINGETVSISKVFEVYWRTLGTNTYLIQSATKRVYHNSDGSKSITISARANGHAAYYGPSASNTTAGDCTASGTVTLNAIPRATTPTLSMAIATMGGSVMVTLAPASSGFKHKLKYSFGALANKTDGLSCGGDFTSAGNTTVTFTPPTSLANQIPSATSGNCTLYCLTYDANGAQIGSEVTKTITLNVPSYTPTATVALTGNNLLSSAYVKGKSTVTASITASSSYGATISSYSSTIDGETYTGQSFTTKVLSNGTKVDKTTVKDSRGKTVTVDSASITVYDYAAPVITAFTLARQSTETTVIATLQGSVSSVNSKNAKTFQVTLNGVTQTITSSSYTLNGTTTFTNVPTDSTLTATAKITDSYTSTTKEAVLPTVAVTLDFYKDGKGVAFGKVAETTDLLEVAWNGKFKKNLNVEGTLTFGGKTLLNWVYPVGSIYMSVNATSPATLFGGTWVQLKDRFLLGAGDSYTNGATGGEEAHTLSVDEIPSHNHPYGVYDASSTATLDINHMATYSGKISSTGWGSHTLYTGGGEAHNNMPPYLAVYMWKRTA